MTHTITKPNFEPHWEPLVRHLGEDLCQHFMFMASYAISGGKAIHTYKHHATRRYLNIDDNGVFYRYQNGAHTQITPEAALAHAYG
jgi:hypothetical protein